MYNYIGIDGGGTHTRCLLANEHFEAIRESAGSASNPLVVGFENSADIIFHLIKKVCGKSVNENLNIVTGIAGCESSANSNKLTGLLLKRLNPSKIPVRNLKVVSDAQIALEGALNGKPGAILIAGTGSVLFGKDTSGKLFKIGGYGKLAGDEGSGYEIGQKGLQAVSKYLDGRGKQTKLANYFAKEYGITNSDEFIAKVYSGKFNIADVSRLVIKAADNGDRICRKILINEIKELILHIKAFKIKTKEKKIILSFGGSLLTNKNFYSRELKRKINDSLKYVKVVKPKHPPVIGAVILAKQLFNFEK